MIDLQKLVDDAAQVARESRRLELSVGGRLVDVRITAMAGTEWSTMTADYPPTTRQSDLTVGCDIRAMLPRALASSAVVLDGDDEQKADAAMWESIIATQDGMGVEMLASTVIDLNLWSPASRLATLKKERRRAQKPKQDSHG